MTFSHNITRSDRTKGGDCIFLKFFVNIYKYLVIFTYLVIFQPKAKLYSKVYQIIYNGLCIIV